MNPNQLDDILRQTLEDHRLSRGERQALGQVLADLTPGTRELATVRHHAFELARIELEGREDRHVLDWLEEVVKVLRAAEEPAAIEVRAEALFPPDDDCPGRVAQLFRNAKRSVDVCVFTITDNQIAAAMLDAHRRGLALRVITDDEKIFDRGSDIERLAGAGIPIRTDGAASHMHNKFALFDRRLLLTGSYNWTRGGARHNQENVVLTDHPDLMKAFTRAFEGLWERFA